MKIASVEEFYRTRLTLLSRLREHGVTVIAGVDSGMLPVKRHGNASRVVEEITSPTSSPGDRGP